MIFVVFKSAHQALLFTEFTQFFNDAVLLY